jgi:ribosomal-protein-alanine N-acetyltransferase
MGVIDAGLCLLEPWDLAHLAGLLAQANDERVSAAMTDRFPFPYTQADAESWIAKCRDERPSRNFALMVDGVVAGGAGFETFDGEETGAAEIGYWLGHCYWGCGLATAAVTALTDYAFAVFDLRRIQAGVFSWNDASARVLEKAGYQLEGRHRQAILKRGRFGDRLMYARLRDDRPR